MNPGSRIKEAMSEKVFNVFNIIILSFLALSCFLPFIHIIAVSFSDKYYSSAGMVTLWPKGFTWNAYEYLLSKTAFWQAFNVSVIRLLLGTAINLFFIMLTAYPLSKDSGKLRIRTLYTWFFFITMLIHGGLIPNYILISELGMRDTIWSLVIPGALPIFYLVLMLNFFRQIPHELEEAAFIDGAGHFRTLVLIYIPLAMPAVATLALFCMVGHWNAWFDGLIYISDPTKVPLQTYLRSAIIDVDMSKITEADMELLKLLSNRAIKSAQIIIAVIPILCVYPFLQRYFVKGIVLGSVKG